MTEGRNGCESACAYTGETGGTGPPGPPGSPAVALSGMDLEYSSSGLGSAAGQYILIILLVKKKLIYFNCSHFKWNFGGGCQ